MITILSEQDKQNLSVLAGALLQIRALTYLTKELTAEDALLEIREIADRLHNVPRMMSDAQPCCASALMAGETKFWPTGLARAATTER